MPVLKKQAEKKPQNSEEKKFPTEKLLRSKKLSTYQPDFAKVILSKPAYTVSEAIRVLDENLKGGK